MKNANIKFLSFAVLLFLAILFVSLIIGKFLFTDKPQPKLQSNNTTDKPLKIMNKDQPYGEIVDKEEVELIFSGADFSKYVKVPTDAKEEIQCEPKKQNRPTYIRAEDMGEDFSTFTTEKILSKLKNGDKIEQRKAAGILWRKFGSAPDKLSDNEKREVANSTKNYIFQINSDFEENFMQVQRLWHLAAPALLADVTNPDNSVSENSARLLSLMKTPQIIDQLIVKSNSAKSAEELRKYIFALQYMKINNRYFLEDRKRMSDDECKAYYDNRVIPQIMFLERQLEKIAKPNEKN